MQTDLLVTGTPNAAQTLVLSFFSGERKFVQTKSPHANQPTPPRPHYPRKNRKKRLFKGHRA